MPDSHGFVYAGDSMGPLAILRTLSDTPGSAVTMVVGNQMAANPSQPAASPSGKYVAFSTQMRGAEWNLAVVGIDGSHLTVLGEGAMPAWSPDEKKICFVRSVSGQNQLFLMNPLTGGELVQITNEGGNGGPAFSPDGRKIVFSSNRQGTGWNLYSVALDGTALTKLTNGEGSALRPHWGKDGWIYFDWAASADGTGNADIWRFMPVGDGSASGGAGTPPSSPTGTPSSPPGTPSSPPGTPSFPPPSSALPPSSPPGSTPPTASPPTSALPPQYPAPKKPKGKK
jgi:Tol biopolymer transport system component